MRRAGYLMDDIAAPDNLYLAFCKARRGKRTRPEVLRYEASLDRNIALLRSSLLSGRADVGHYSYFHINDPKPRLICAAAFPERVLHHALMNVCHPYFERNLIETTYATRPGKGIYKAIARAGRASRRYPYAAKFDFRKYFDSIDHAILKGALRRLFKDTRLLSVFDTIIGSYCRKPGKGIPIGNLTSQYFANYYLSQMDHRCLEVLHAGEYIRYMDDFIVYAADRATLDGHVEAISRYASEELLLELKPVVRLHTCGGIPFLGYCVYPHKLLLNGRSKRRLARKLRLCRQLMDRGIWSEAEYLNHVTPLLAFAGHACTRRLRNVCCGWRAPATNL